jgi:predicted nucleic acid-binding protein
MTSMTGRTFVDTNIWVYSVDRADPEKHARARAAIAPSNDVDLVVSSQVLGEFYTTVTRKLRHPVSEPDAGRMLEELRRLPVVAVDRDHVIEAVDSSRAWKISYWDALILAAARSAGCRRVLSEDLADRQSYGDVRVENPLRPPPTPRVSDEAPLPYTTHDATLRQWDDTELAEALGRYERESADAGMTRNAVHSYWDYARRFLAWRAGDYVPRGSTSGVRPVPLARVSADELAQQARTYASAIEAAGREKPTVDTYYRHAMFFVRWLRGDFKPGGRLR